MSNQGVSIAFKLTALVLLLGILGVSIGVLIVDLNIRDDVEATPAAPDNFKNIPDGEVIQQSDNRFSKFQQISDLYEKWMDVTADPCDDFYHYVCGNGQKTKEQSPFTISQNKDDDIITRMWNAPSSYWNAAPLPVKQAKWIVDKCHNDNSYTLADQQKKIVAMLKDYIGYTNVNVPFLYPKTATTMDKTALSKLLGYGKGQYGAFALLTTFVSTDFKKPDTDPYRFYVDQPLPIFIDSVYTDDQYPTKKPELVAEIANTMKLIATKLGVTTDDAALEKMAGDMVDFDRVISQTMQQDPIVRRQVERNYNQHTLAELNTKTDQFDWVPYIQSAMTLLGNRATADGNTVVIIMEEKITLNLLNDLVKKTDTVTVANYVYWKVLSQILTAVPPPTGHKEKANPMAKFRAVLNTDKRTLTGMLRKVPDTSDQLDAPVCTAIVQAVLPWAASRMYVDTDIPNKDTRKTLKSNVEEIAQWIFFGFRSQLDQLNWMDDPSKKGAFDKLNQIQLNVAYPDWVADDAQITDYYKGLDITAEDNFMNQWIKLTNYLRLQQVLPLVDKPARDRTDFSSFIGITNAWYQPQMNSITFPEGILQEPFYSPDFPLATIFGGLGSISGHELTHGFDDQGVQWDGIGALNAWMSPDSQKDFNKMAQCVIDEYSSFCPFPGVCVNGANTQGENIADNGGIQAAYKALKAYESLKGADPRLPGFGSSFSSDQLFFLTFGQTWCDKDQSEDSFKNQIAKDVHSPAIYRVLGTIQNFPAFRNAFNCPVGKKYTPADHCDVWTSVPFK